MTNAEKAKRYDALMFAIRMTVNSLKADIGNYPKAEEVGNNIIKACEYGSRVQCEIMLTRMERWLREGGDESVCYDRDA